MKTGRMTVTAPERRVDVTTVAACHYEVQIIEDTAGFLALESEWNRLLEMSAMNNLFLTWEWMFNWWQRVAQHRQLHIITIRDHGILLAIAPLCVRPPRPVLLQFFRTCGFLGAGEVGSDYLDIIIHPAHEESVLRVLALHLAGNKIVLELTQIHADSTRVSKLAGLLEKQDWKVSSSITDVCPYITLAGHTWETYLHSCGSSHRYNFRRRLKNISRKYDFSFERATTESQVREILPRMIELHNSRWDQRGGSDAFHTDGLLSFHREFSLVALHRGWLRLYALRLDGRIAAALYGFIYNDVFYFYQSGFDVLFAADSVGMVLMGLAIRSAIGERVSVYDFLHGDEEYKYRWTGEQAELSRHILVPPSLKGALYLRKSRLKELIKRVTHKYLSHPVPGLSQ